MKRKHLCLKVATIGFVLVAQGLSSTEVYGSDFASRWPAGIERVWIGPEYFANRLQDWRINDGRLECVEARRNFPLRTVHLLTHSLASPPGPFSMSVVTGPIDSEAGANPDSWAGFLIGAGNDKVDYRLSALVHHRPAEDGGLLAIVNGRGMVAFRDNTKGSGGGGLWSIGGALGEQEAPIIKPTSLIGQGRPAGASNPIRLHFEGGMLQGGYSLTITATDAVTGRLLSEAAIDNVEPKMVDGAIALVSHLGPIGSDRGFWFRDWKISGPKVVAHADRNFGPILTSQYTLSRGILKLTAQMGPLGEDDTKTAELQIRSPGVSEWRTAATANLIDDSYTFPFRVENWDSTRDTPYRIVYRLKTGGDETRTYDRQGMIRAEPWSKDSFVVAAFTGHKIYTGGLQWNEQSIWFPHSELVAAVGHHRPDFLFFSGDQIYEGDLTPAHARPTDKAILDYLYKWYRWCWAFGDLTRDIPSVTIPDDHDVYHGNIWGAAGKAARAAEGITAQDSGGYKMSPRFVNAVHRTQTSHLPDPVDPAPVLQGISVYTTRVEYAGMSFAVIADRQWKSSPTVAVPEGKVVNGWFQDPQFDPAARADVPGAVLLGDRQLEFLRDWSTDWSNQAWMKVVLSQTLFANVATLPKTATSGAVLPSLPYLPAEAYPDDHKLAADADSNAWPQTGRNKALREMRRGFALHIAGDQHLGSTIQYGVDDWGDAGFALCVPSVANTWPRRWYPPMAGLNRRPGAPRYTGDFKDGFGNFMTVHAVSNPVKSGRQPAGLHDRAPGYGIVRFSRSTRDIVIECWPRWADPSLPDAKQYPGWPIHINQLDNYNRKAAAWLPTLQVRGVTDPVVQIVEEATGEMIYALRIKGQVFQPRVFQPGTYTIRVGDPDADRMKTLPRIRAAVTNDETIVIDLR